MDLETRRKKQKALMSRMVERKVRERAQQLYVDRGQEDGHALKDWFQAEQEIIGNTVFGPLYRRHISDRLSAEREPDSELTAQ